MFATVNVVVVFVMVVFTVTNGGVVEWKSLVVVEVVPTVGVVWILLTVVLVSDNGRRGRGASTTSARIAMVLVPTVVVIINAPMLVVRWLCTQVVIMCNVDDWCSGQDEWWKSVLCWWLLWSLSPLLLW